MEIIIYESLLQPKCWSLSNQPIEIWLVLLMCHFWRAIIINLYPFLPQ